MDGKHNFQVNHIFCGAWCQASADGVGNRKQVHCLFTCRMDGFSYFGENGGDHGKMGKTLYLNLIRLDKFRPEDIRESPIYFSIEIKEIADKLLPKYDAQIMKCISPLVLVLVSEDAGVPVAGPVAVVSLVSLVVPVAGVGVAGVVTVAVAGVAGVVVAGSQQRVAIVSVATEEVLALQNDDDIKMNIQYIKCSMHLYLESIFLLILR